MRRCPCCGYLTIDDSEKVISDICEVCFWQYDEVSQKRPNDIIGANKVSLDTAKKIINYLELLSNVSLIWFLCHIKMKYKLLLT